MAVSDWKIDDGGGGFSSPIVVAVLDRLSSSVVNVAQLNPEKNIPSLYPTFSLLNGTAAGGRGWKTVLAFMCCGGAIAPL